MPDDQQAHQPAPLGEQYALLLDLYELTMAASYFEEDMHEEATFSLFIRNYPPDRGYFVAAGLAEALNYLLSLRFTAGDLAYLESTRLFKPAFLVLENRSLHRRGLGIARRQHFF